MRPGDCHHTGCGCAPDPDQSAARCRQTALETGTASQLLNLAPSRSGARQIQISPTTTWTPSPVGAQKIGTSAGASTRHTGDAMASTPSCTTHSSSSDSTAHHTGMAMSRIPKRGWIASALPHDERRRQSGREAGRDAASSSGPVASCRRRRTQRCTAVGAMAGCAGTGSRLLTACQRRLAAAQVQREFADALARAGSRAAPLLAARRASLFGRAAGRAAGQLSHRH